VTTRMTRPLLTALRIKCLQTDLARRTSLALARQPPDTEPARLAARHFVPARRAAACSPTRRSRRSIAAAYDH
jgi:hypothetical protein